MVNLLQSLDFVVSEARRYGIRLILSLVNNFDDFGGRQQYVQWAGSAGISINSDDDFYTNTFVKGYYRNHVKAWAQEMAAYTKSLDSNHLLEVGMEGFYGDSTPEKQQYNPGYHVGTDFISTNLISEVDFATIHAYPDIWLSGQTDGSQDSFVQRWMWSHWQDAMKMLKKPLVFAEFGKSKKDPGYTIAERNVYIDIVYGDIYNFARSGGAFGGGLVWQIMAEGMDSYYDGYEIVLSQDVTTDGVIARQSHLMTALSHTLSRPHGSTLGAAAELKAAQELSGQQPHAVHRSSSRSLRRHGRRLGRPARSETPPSK
ncbi:hypothetical protein Taro_043290 [Colocasia esculenta]|uniref:mannan endo-1,4-beta-mannosidase n=1 Tax=Colocasia esculenta TaxID=4460 RepID=A0A843X0D3_COLES|nr:hypothetical protein [Colocasia esculenta]